MRIVHITKACHALTTGGTERYILELVREAQKLDSRQQHSIGWIWDHYNRGDATFISENVRITPLHTRSARIDQVEADFNERAEKSLYGDETPDLLHFHTFGMAEAAIANIATKRGTPYVFTYHSPAWSCRRETLLRWGREVCDGKVGALRCSACKLQERLGGFPLLGRAGSLLSIPLGAVGRFFGGKIHRRTAFVEDTWHFKRAFKSFLGQASRVLSCCEWSHPVLERNGAQPERIVHCPQGVPMEFVKAVRDGGQGTEDGGRWTEVGEPGTSNIERLTSNFQRTTDNPDPQANNLFTVGYVGRLTPVKGIHILVEAFCRTGYPDARLHVYGWSPSRSTGSYAARIEKIAAGDSRVTFVGKLPFDDMVGEYRKLDLLAIPSVWLETGPLTLLEAVQLGVPVWGSENIGQMGVLKESGKVVGPNTVQAWQDAMEQAFQEHSSGDWKGIGLRQVRTMGDVASEMHDVYKQLQERG